MKTHDMVGVRQYVYGMRNVLKSLNENFGIREYLRDLGVNGRLLLQRILEKWSVVCGLNLMPPLTDVYEKEIKFWFS
jgi:hypothetical protein